MLTSEEALGLSKWYANEFQPLAHVQTARNYRTLVKYIDEMIQVCANNWPGYTTTSVGCDHDDVLHVVMLRLLRLGYYTMYDEDNQVLYIDWSGEAPAGYHSLESFRAS